MAVRSMVCVVSWLLMVSAFGGNLTLSSTSPAQNVTVNQNADVTFCASWKHPDNAGNDELQPWDATYDWTVHKADDVDPSQPGVLIHSESGGTKTFTYTFDADGAFFVSCHVHVPPLDEFDVGTHDDTYTWMVTVNPTTWGVEIQLRDSSVEYDDMVGATTQPAGGNQLSGRIRMTCDPPGSQTQPKTVDLARQPFGGNFTIHGAPSGVRTLPLNPPPQGGDKGPWEPFILIGTASSVDLDDAALMVTDNADGLYLGSQDLTVVQVDLRWADITNAHEENPGKLLGVAQPDEFGQVPEDQFGALGLFYFPGALNTGSPKLSTTSGGSRISLWEDTGKAAAVTDPQDWTLSNQTPPPDVFVEGTSATGCAREVAIKLEHLTVSGTLSEDIVNLTLVQVDIGVNAALSDQDDGEENDVVCRHSTDPAGRPTIGCRARLRGYTGAAGQLAVVLTDQPGGGELRFAGESDASVQIQLPKNGDWVAFDISGQTESAIMNDAVIESRLGTAGGPVCGREDVTVLWVSGPLGDPDALGRKKDAAQTVSPQNSQRDNYHNWAFPNTYSLGLRRFMTGGWNRMSFGMEWHGVVHPSDFAVPAGADISLTRDAQCRYFWQDGRTLRAAWVRDFSPSAPPGNDPGPAWAHDSTPPDLYDVDAPGVPFERRPQGFVWRTRGNYRELAAFTLAGQQPVRCSNDFRFWERMTYVQIDAPDGTNWVQDNTVPNDNRCGKGTTGLAWDSEN